MKQFQDEHGVIIDVESVTWHRNGVGGEGYYGVVFYFMEEDTDARRCHASVFFDQMLALDRGPIGRDVKDTPKTRKKIAEQIADGLWDRARKALGYFNPACAVITPDDLTATWRGDHFFPALCMAIEHHALAERRRFNREIMKQAHS